MRAGITWLKSLCRLSLLALIFAGLAGCSSSLFSDGAAELQRLKGNGNFNRKCLGIKLPKPQLSPEAFVQLVDCLNQDGAIHEFAALVHSMTGEEKALVVGLINDELLGSPKRLSNLDKSVRKMSELGIIKRGFPKMALVLEKGRLVKSAVKLLREGSLDSRGKVDPALITSLRLLTEDLSRDASGRVSLPGLRDNVGRALEFATMMSNTKSYRAMVEGLKSNIPLRDSRFNLEFLADLGLEYVQAKIRAPIPYVKTILWGVEDGTFLEAFDHYFEWECEGAPPSQCARGRSMDLHSQVRALEQFVQLLVVDPRDKEEIFGPVTDLFRAMNGPVNCMGGTKQIPNMDMYVLNEFIAQDPLQVPSWVLRTNALKVVLANSTCNLPRVHSRDGWKTFNQANLALRNMAIHRDGETGAEGRPLVTVAHFTKGLEIGDNKPISQLAAEDLGAYPGDLIPARYRWFLINWLGDKDEEINAYTHLADSVAELSRSERRLIGNLLYFVNVVGADSQERRDLQSATRSLMRLRPELASSRAGFVPGSNPARWRSVYDVLSDAMLRIDAATLVEFLSALSDLIDSPEAIVAPFLEVSREAALMNNANPLLEVIQSVGLKAEKNEKLLNALFAIIDREEFVQAMRLAATMATNDSLEDLVKGVLSLLRGGSSNDDSEPVTQVVPAVRKPNPERDLDASSPTTPIVFDSAPPPAHLNACWDLNFDVRMSDPFSTTDQRLNWEKQVTNMGICTNTAAGDYDSLESALQYGLKEKVIAPDGTEKSVLGFITQLASKVIPDSNPFWDLRGDTIRDLYDEISDIAFHDESRRDLQKTCNLLPFLFEERRYCSVYGDNSLSGCDAERISVAQALLRAAGATSGMEREVQDILNFAKTVVESTKAPKPASLLYWLYKDAGKIPDPITPTEKPPLVSFPVNTYPRNLVLKNALDEAIRKYEKREPDEKARQEKIEDYWQQPQSHVRRYYTENGQRRIGYKDVDEFKKEIEPLLRELSMGDRLEWAMKFFFFMDGKPYTPEWWSWWFRRLASRVHAIPYYYPDMQPGKDKPVVRLVNELDILELMVLDGDFSLKELGQLFWNVRERKVNFSIKYLTKLGTAKDLSDPLDEMANDLEFFTSLTQRLDWAPDWALKPEVKRRIFNLNQIYPIFKSINRETEYYTSDGRKIVANDLGVLRDLFYKVLGATPEKDWNKYTRASSLSLVIGIVRAGILRNAGVNMWFMNRNPNPEQPVNIDDDDPDNRHVVPALATPALRFLIDAAMLRKNGKQYINPDAVEAVGYLIRQDCAPVSSGAPCVAAGGKELRNFDERYVLIGRIVNQLWDWTKDDNLREARGESRAMMLLKRAGYYGMQLFDRLSIDSAGLRGGEVNRKVVKVLKTLVANPKGAELIGNNLDLVEPFINELRSIHFLRLLLEAETSAKRFGDQEFDFEARQAFAELRDLSILLLDKLAERDQETALEAVVVRSAVDLVYAVYKSPDLEPAKAAIRLMWDDPEFRKFREDDLDRIVDNIVLWLPKEPNRQHARLLRKRTQEVLATHLGNGDIAALTKFFADNSSRSRDELYQKLKFLGEKRYVEDIMELITLLTDGAVDIHSTAGRR